MTGGGGTLSEKGDPGSDEQVLQSWQKLSVPHVCAVTVEV